MQWLREAGGYDEIFEKGGQPRSHYDELVAALGALDPAEIQRRERLQPAHAAQPGHHLHGLRREAEGRRARLPVRLRAPHHPRRRVEEPPGRPGPAHHRAQPLPADVYQDQKLPQGRDRARGARPLAQGVQARAARRDRRPGRSTPTWSAPTHPRTTSGEYLVLEDNCRVPERRLLRAREPQPPEPRRSRSSSRSIRCARSRTTRRSCSRRCASWPRGAGQNPVGGAPDARASTTPPTSSIPSSRARWGSRSSRGATSWSRTITSSCARTARRRQRVDVIYRRIDDDFLDPARLPARQHARRARPGQRLPRGQRGARQRAGRRRGRRQGRSTPSCRDLITYYLGEDAAARPGARPISGCEGRLQVHQRAPGPSSW